MEFNDRWDLSYLYPDFGEAFQKDLESLEEEGNQIGNLLDDESFPTAENPAAYLLRCGSRRPGPLPVRPA